jgi:hypothetical protein
MPAAEPRPDAVAPCCPSGAVLAIRVAVWVADGLPELPTTTAHNSPSNSPPQHTTPNFPSQLLPPSLSPPPSPPLPRPPPPPARPRNRAAGRAAGAVKEHPFFRQGGPCDLRRGGLPLRVGDDSDAAADCGGGGDRGVVSVCRLALFASRGLQPPSRRPCRAAAGKLRLAPQLGRVGRAMGAGSGGHCGQGRQAATGGAQATGRCPRRCWGQRRGRLGCSTGNGWSSPGHGPVVAAGTGRCGCAARTAGRYPCCAPGLGCARAFPSRLEAEAPVCCPTVRRPTVRRPIHDDSPPPLPGPRPTPASPAGPAARLEPGRAKPAHNLGACSRPLAGPHACRARERCGLALCGGGGANSAPFRRRLGRRLAHCQCGCGGSLLPARAVHSGLLRGLRRASESAGAAADSARSPSRTMR